jgi:transcriptional regulator with XRE-family HTH domain
MRCEAEMARLTEYIRGFISGERIEVDVIDERELDALRRQPLRDWLGVVADSGCRIRGARGTTPRDIIDLLEQVRTQSGLTKLELASRSGVSRGHLSTLLTATDPNPTLETVVRIALGLGFALEVLDRDDAAFDDAEPAFAGDEALRGTGGEGAARANMFRTLGASLLGATSIGVGLFAKSPGLRRGSLLVGASLFAGTLVAGVVRVLQGRRDET